LVQRYRSWFKLFWLRGDAAFANPETYEYCEEHRITYFIRLPSNANLIRLLEPYLNRPVGRPPKNGIQVKIVDLHYQAKSWSRPRRVVAKIEWHRGELFPRIGFVVTSSRLPAGKVTKVYTEKISGAREEGPVDSSQPSAIGFRFSVFGFRLSVVGCQRSGARMWGAPCARNR